MFRRANQNESTAAAEDLLSDAAIEALAALLTAEINGH